MLHTDPSVSLRVLWFRLFHHVDMSALSPPSDAAQVFKPGQVWTGDVSVLIFAAATPVRVQLD